MAPTCVSQAGPLRVPATIVAMGALALGFATPARAAGIEDLTDQWLPRGDGAEWVYAWSNSTYSATERQEKVTVQERDGTAFRLRWVEEGVAPSGVPAAGAIDFKQTEAGLVNLNYQSTPPPAQFPILCASATDCGNSIAGTLFLVIWGTRSPTIAEPLLAGTRWNSLGGATNDVVSVNRYVGRQRISVRAFPNGVDTARIESDISQAGALGDPFGSGIRTTWWVRGVGPVRVSFRHASGETSRAELVQTNLTPLAAPSDVNLLPLNRGDRARFRWRNSRYMRRWSRQRFEVTAVQNNSARVEARHLSGPISVVGSYTFTTRLSGVTHIAAYTRAATRVRFPALGPFDVPADQRRHFFTPYDLMVYGFGPVVPVDATPGETWRSSRESRDWRVFGVSGHSRIVGPRRVRTPAGTYHAVLVRSTLTNRGSPFGSGTRRSWFAPGRGLVKLVFRHRDGSISTVERLP